MLSLFYEKYRLDTEEKELMTSINSGKWQKSTDINDDISTHNEYAKNFLEKDKKIPTPPQTPPQGRA